MLKIPNLWCYCLVSCVCLKKKIGKGIAFLVLLIFISNYSNAQNNITLSLNTYSYDCITGKITFNFHLQNTDGTATSSFHSLYNINAGASLASNQSANFTDNDFSYTGDYTIGTEILISAYGISDNAAPYSEFRFTPAAPAAPSKPSITLPALPLCNGASGTLSANGGGGTYTWYFNTGATGHTGLTYDVTAAGDYTITETNFCGTSVLSDIVTVTTANTPTKPTISATATTLCSPATADLTANGAGGTYNWSNGSHLTTITVSAAGSYAVEEANSCGTSPISDPVVISVNTVPVAPTLNVSGTITLCNGASQTISTTPGTTGGVIHWSTGATGNSITVNTAGTYYAYEGNVTCGSGPNSANVIIVTNVDPVAPTVTSSNGLILCNGTSTTLSTTPGTVGGVIHWSTGATGNSIVVSTAGSYYAYEINSCSQSPNSSNVVITTNTTPNSPSLNVTGTINLCNGATQTISTTPGTVGGVINWSTGATGNSIVVSTAGTYYAYESNPSCGSGTNSLNVIITTNVTPGAPTVNSSNGILLCNGASTTLSTAPATVGGVIHWSTGATGNSIVVSTAGTYYAYEVNSCGTGANSASIVITTNVTPGAPTVNSSNGTLLCNGASTTLSTTPATVGGVIHWSSGATGNSIVVSTAGTYYAYEVNNCATGANSTSIVIATNVTPGAPTVNSSNGTLLCNGASTTLSTTPGTVGGVIHWSTGATGNSIVVSTAGTYYAYEVNNCATGANSSNVVITTNNNPIVNPITGLTAVCTGLSITLLDATPSGVWSSSNGLATVDLSGNVTGVTSGSVTISYAVTNICGTTTVTYPITVNPTPTVVSVTPQVLCNGFTTTSVVFSGAVSGTSFGWTNSQSLIGIAATGSGTIAPFAALNTGNTPAVASIVVTPTATGCTGSSTSFTITVNPTPTVVSISPQVLCNGYSTTTISFTGAVIGTAFAWTNTQNSIGLPTTGVGDINSFAAVNNGNSPVLATITVRPSANNCQGSTTSFTITVNPTPTVVSVTPQVLCNGFTTTSVVFSGAVSGTSFGWTNSQSLIGIAATGSGTIAPFAALNTGNTPAVASIVVTPTATGCTGSSTSFTITVNPTPTVVSISPQVLCNGFSVTSIGFTGAVIGTTFAWTNTQNSIGLPATGVGDINSFAAVNNGNSPVVATIAVRPSANNCQGSTTSFTITVNPTPTVGSVTPQVLCNGFTTTSVVFSGAVSGTSFGWTNSQSSIGIASTGSGTFPPFAALNTGNYPAVASIVVTPTATGCTGSSTSFTITVNPTPTVVSISPQVLCNGFSVTSIGFTGAVIGTTFVWTNTQNSIGLPATGAGDISSFAAVNNGNSPVVATITVRPSANNCQGSSTSFTITVNPTPTVVSVTSQVLCNGFTTTAVVFSGAVSGTIYTWVNSNTSMGLGYSGIGNFPIFQASNTTNLPVFGNITVTPVNQSCQGSSTSFTITVNPTPSITTISPQVVCNGLTSTLISFTAAVDGTVVQWTNTQNSIGLPASGTGEINPFVAFNSGNIPVIANIIAVPKANNCSASATTFSITVNPSPVAAGISALKTLLCNEEVSSINIKGFSFGNIYTLIKDGSPYKTTQTDSSLKINLPGTYSLLSTSDKGCNTAYSSPIKITVGSISQPTINGVLRVCTDGKTSVAVTPLDPTKRYESYTWSTGSAKNISQDSSFAAGASNLSVIVKRQGCYDSASAIITNDDTLYPKGQLQLSANSIDYGGQILAYANVTNAVKYRWDMGDGNKFNTTNNKVFENYLVSGDTLLMQVWAYSQRNCITKFSTFIKVAQQRKDSIPNLSITGYIKDWNWFPSPFRLKLRVSVILSQAEQVNIQMFTADGAFVRSWSLSGQKGENVFTLDKLEGLASNVTYLVTATYNGIKHFDKIFKY